MANAAEHHPQELFSQEYKEADLYRFNSLFNQITKETIHFTIGSCSEIEPVRIDG